MEEQEILRQYDRLDGEHICLRRFILADAPAVFAYGSDPEVVRYLSWGPLTAPEQAAQTILLRYLNNPSLWAIALPENDLCIGCIDLRVEPGCAKGSFGYCLAREYWGRGYAAEALELILRLGLGVLGLNKMEGSHYGGNTASGRVQEKCGMIREGILRQNVWAKGRWWDLVCYGILREEWLARQKNTLCPPQR